MGYATGLPDMELAKTRRRNAMPSPNEAISQLPCWRRLVRCLTCSCCAADRLFMGELPKYGVGTYMYFSGIKRISWVFLLMSTLALPSLVTHIAMNKDGVEGCPDSAQLCLMYTMLGNLPPEQDRFWEDDFFISGRGISPEGVFLMYSVADACYMLCFFVFVAWFGPKQLAEVAELDDQAITTSDFTVDVTGLWGDLGGITSGRSIAALTQELKGFLEQTLLKELETDQAAQRGGKGWIPALAVGSRNVEGAVDGGAAMTLGFIPPRVVELTLSLGQRRLLKLLSQREKLVTKHTQLAVKAGLSPRQSLDLAQAADEASPTEASPTSSSLDLSTRVQGGAEPEAEVEPEAEGPSVANTASNSTPPPDDDEDEEDDDDEEEDGPGKRTKREKAAAKLLELDAEIATELAERQQDSRVVCAFVTFEQCEHATSIARMYGGVRNSTWCGCCQRSALRWQGRRLKVGRAPEPSDVVWRHHGYAKVGLWLRRALTALVTVSMLAVSAALLYFANKKKSEVSVPSACQSAVCPPAVGAAAVGAAASTMPPAMRPAALQNLTCAVNTPDVVVTVRTHPLLAAADGTPLCVGADAYCLALAFDEMLSDDELCKDAIVEYYKNFALGLVPVLAVVVINTLLKTLLKKLVQVEKHATVSGELAATAAKLFCAQFLNTSVIVFAVSSSGINKAVEVEGLPASAGGVPTLEEFQQKWYADVGTGICLTLLLNAVVPKLVVFLKEAIGCAKRSKCCAKKKKTQIQLDQLFAPPEFDIATRCAQALNTVFSCLFFASGMPILLAVAFLDLSLLFAADKYMFTHFYKKPPQYGDTMARLVAGLLPWAGALHLFMACWTFSSSFVQTSSYKLFLEHPDTSKLPERLLSRTAALPVLVLLVLVSGRALLHRTPAVLLVRWLPACKRVLGRPCTNHQSVRVAPATSAEMQQQQQQQQQANADGAQSPVVASTAAADTEDTGSVPSFGRSVLHVAKYGLETYELSRNQRYAPAFEGELASWMVDQAAGGGEPWTHGVLHTRCVPAYTTWRSAELAARLQQPMGAEDELQTPSQLRKEAAARAQAALTAEAAAWVVQQLHGVPHDGVWSGSGGWEYQVSVTVDSADVDGGGGDGQTVHGEARWTLQAAAPGSGQQSKEGATCAEKLEGTLSGRTLVMQGSMSGEDAELFAPSRWQLVGAPCPFICVGFVD